MTMMERLLSARCGATERSPHVAFFNFTPPTPPRPSALFLFVLISAAPSITVTLRGERVVLISRPVCILCFTVTAGEQKTLHFVFSFILSVVISPVRALSLSISVIDSCPRH